LAAFPFLLLVTSRRGTHGGPYANDWLGQPHLNR
jgi:hypothetical protein